MIEKVKEKLPWLKEISEGKVKEFVDSLLEYGINGVGPISGSETLASEYRKDSKFNTIDGRVNSLIKWETSKNFGTGFASGVGGLITLPISIPASMGISFILQIRLAGAIASLYGYSIEEDRVKTFILLCIIGEAGKEVLKNSGVSAANTIASHVLKSIPSKVLVDINEKVGFKLLARTGEEGALNIMKIVPIAGGLVSGVIDSVSCFVAGKSAKKIFGKDKPAELDEFYNLKFTEEQLSKIISSNSNDIKKVSVPGNGLIKIKIKRMPGNLDLKMKSYSSGVIYLYLKENFVMRKIVHSVFRHQLEKSDEKIRSMLYFKDKLIVVKLNDILKEYLNLSSVEIKNIEIVKGELRIIMM